MSRRDRYGQWGPESRALLVAFVLWLPHGGLMSVDRIFALTWIVHAAIVGIWGLWWMWRAGSENRRLYLHRKWSGPYCPVCKLALLWNLSGSYQLKLLHEKWGGRPCHVCNAQGDEPCDAGLHG